MLIRFCLYGFLKNQRYFEPFLVLAFLDKGLTFLAIGTLLAIEAATMNLLEVPSGALADLFGRRRSMVLSFAAYAVSFFVFGMAQSFAGLGVAMVLFGIGESFRTGTHKALIFTWLNLEGRSDEKTRVYGLTRSWSKYGSAVSALIAAPLVLVSGSYDSVFFWSILPCALSIVNLLGYPASIDPDTGSAVSMRAILAHLRAGLRDAFRRGPVRRLMIESMTFNGVFRATKDYLQPALLAAAVAWFAGSTANPDLQDSQKVAFLAGPVYFVLFLAAGLASRNAAAFARWSGGDDAAARRLWALLAVLFAVLAIGSAGAAWAVVIIGFACVHVLQNLWRPIQTSRIYARVEHTMGATVLSIESQGQRTMVAVLAPLFGLLIDAAGSFWPAGAIAAAIAGIAAIAAVSRRIGTGRSS